MVADGDRGKSGRAPFTGPVRFFAYVTTTSETRVLPATGRFKHSDDGMASVVKAMSLGRIIVQGAMYRQFKGG